MFRLPFGAFLRSDCRFGRSCVHIAVSSVSVLRMLFRAFLCSDCCSEAFPSRERETTSDCNSGRACAGGRENRLRLQFWALLLERARKRPQIAILGAP
eukprot:3751116-Pyramimonas_sp.AAC.1